MANQIVTQSNEQASSSLVTFLFQAGENDEAHDVRATDKSGVSWFVLRDLLAAAKSSTKITDAADSIIQGLGDEFVADLPIKDAVGRTQRTVIVAEPAVTYLLSRSNTEQGRKLNRFIHVEVLPSIRKTGSYSAAPPPVSVAMLPSQVGKQIILDMMEVATLFGTPKSCAIQLAASTATLTTGLPWDKLLTQAAGMNDVPHEDVMLEPTELGKMFELSGVKMNRWLADHGLQTRVAGEWKPTDAGAALCQRHAWVSGAKSGYNLKWRAAEIERLMDQELFTA